MAHVVRTSSPRFGDVYFKDAGEDRIATLEKIVELILYSVLPERIPGVSQSVLSVVYVSGFIYFFFRNKQK